MIVEVSRGDEVESTHRVQGVVCSASGREELCAGDPEILTYWRSAMKPFQAIPLLEDGAAEAFGFGPEELALVCASHGGMRQHTERVAGMLRRLGLAEDHLHCGPHDPFDRDTAQVLSCAGRLAGRIHNNCSGKHAGMLALALHHGWPIEGYEKPDHPVQQRVRKSLADWMDHEPQDHQWALDGCGVPTPRMPLHEMARAYSRLVRRAADGDPGARAVANAMTRFPQLTSSPGRVPLEIMEATAGRLLAKEGAEGVLCVAALDEDWGMAVKVEDGSIRAVGPAAVELMRRSGVLRGGEQDALAAVAESPIRNTLGEVVGRIRAREEAGSD
ncbi:MAG: asparaginase [marine benthic group bacterium]|nr:asparaginase [Candidatus Benthicola marisminoris]